MRFPTTTAAALTGLAYLGLATAADTSSGTSDTVPKSTDASAFLSEVSATPSWATGKYATTLASALYSVETSFVLASDYPSIVDAIWSAASKDGGDGVLASMSSVYWDWDKVTTNDWYTNNVPKALQTEVAHFDSAWDSAFTSVEAKATATGSENAAAARCTGMAVAGVVAGVAAVAGVF